MQNYFCIQCGTTLGTQLVSGRQRLVCPACGWTMWSRASLGVGGLLTVEGRVLLIQRNIQPNAGMWTLVNGYVEADENLEQAVQREFYEETGLKVRPSGLLAIWQTPTLSTQPDEILNTWEHVNNCWCVFSVKLDGPLSDLHPDSSEVREVRFCTPQELDSLDYVGHWSRWMVEHYCYEEGVMFHQGIDPTLMATLRNPLTVVYAGNNT